MSISDTTRALLCAAVLAAAGLLAGGACTPKGATEAPVAPAPPPTVEPAPDDALERLKPRLERLAERLEDARQRYHVPGMAVAVVKDDSVVFARGFGHANIEDKVEVDPRTLFAIGSSTKAFTATLVGMMVDEEKLTWDDPLQQHVPEIGLAVRGDKGAQATIRDVLCHRSGFTRMSMLWISGEVPRNEFLAQASKAKPLAKHREKFLYNNVTFTAAGEAAARVADTTWTELLQSRLLEPLGMKDSIVSKADVDASTSIAQGYRWDKRNDRFETLPRRPLDPIAPAGAITSNVLDMTKWLRFQLGKGRFESNRLIAAETLKETWTSQMKIGGGVSYGMGWFLEPWSEKQVVHHGGNIDGFSAMVAMIPEEGLGFVLLTNVSFTALQAASREIVFDTMLGELDPETPSEDLLPYVGSYVADFGAFGGAPFKVTAKAGKLFVDVPQQMNYELKPPGTDGRRAFAQTDQIAISFEKGAAGKIQVLRLHQGGLDFELLRKGYVPPAEVPLADLAKYEGFFESDKLGRARVFVRNNRLAVDVPKQMVYELNKPDAEGKWTFRVKNDIAVTFGSEKRGPKTMTVHQEGTQITLKRVKAGKSLPSVDVVMRKRRAGKLEKRLAKIGVLHTQGKITIVQAGVEGTFDGYWAPDGRLSFAMDYGRYGKARTVIYGDGGWEHSNFGPDETLEGKLLGQAKALSLVALAGDWRRAFASVRVTGKASVAGREVLLVTGTHDDLPKHDLKVDPKTGDVIEEAISLLWRGPGAIPTTRKFSDIRKVLGLRLAHRIVSRDEPSGEVVMVLDSVEKYEGDPAGLFPKQPE